MPPISIMIKPSSGNCNLACKYCFYRSVADARENYSYGYMNNDTMHNVIDSALAYANGQDIFFTFQGGEPLLSGKEFFRQFTLYVNQKNSLKSKVFYGVQTNGILIDSEFCKIFKDNNMLIGLSLDGNRATNCYRVNGNGSETFTAVLEATRLLSAEGIDFNIVTVVTKKVCENIEEVYSYFKKQGFKFLQFIPVLKPLHNYKKNNLTKTKLFCEDFLRADLDKNNSCENSSSENTYHENNGREKNSCENAYHENGGSNNNGRENNCCENSSSENTYHENNGRENNSCENAYHENGGSNNNCCENSSGENGGCENSSSLCADTDVNVCVDNDDLYMNNEEFYRYLVKLFSLYYNDFVKGDYHSVRYFDNLYKLIKGENAELCGINGYCSRQFVIEGNGNVYPCDFYCLDEYLLGNINEQNFLVLSLSKTAVDFVADGATDKSKCDACAYYKLCRGGCKRQAIDFDYCEAYKKFFKMAIPYFCQMN